MTPVTCRPLTDTDEDHDSVCEALRCVKELITTVDSKVNEHEKKRRLKEIHRCSRLTSAQCVDTSVSRVLYS